MIFSYVKWSDVRFMMQVDHNNCKQNNKVKKSLNFDLNLYDNLLMQKHIKIKDYVIKVWLVLAMLVICYGNAQAIDAQINNNTSNIQTNKRQTVAQDNASDSLPIIKTKHNTIAMDFQNADVKYVLRAICQFAGYNLVMSDTVQGSVTIKLDDIKWDEALQLILQVKNLGLRKNGNILRIAPNAELLEQDKLSLERDKLQNSIAALESLEFVTLRLKYAKAMTVKDMITQKAFANNTESADSVHGIKMLSTRGSLLVDERSNSLFIKDSPSYINGIKQLIKEIDTPVKQVLIEARIVQADKTLEQDLGSRLLALNKGKTIVSNNLNNALDITQKTMPQQPLLTNFANTNPSIATIFSPTSTLLLGLELDAAEMRGSSKTLSYPKLITTNYQTANIQQGMKIPYHNSSKLISVCSILCYGMLYYKGELDICCCILFYFILWDSIKTVLVFILDFLADIKSSTIYIAVCYYSKKLEINYYWFLKNI